MAFIVSFLLIMGGFMSFALSMAASRNKTDDELYNCSLEERLYNNAETGQRVLAAFPRPKFPVTVEVLNVACVACEQVRTLQHWLTPLGYQVRRIKCGCGLFIEVVKT